MNNNEIIIGIDFGHGETSAALCEIVKAKSSGQLEAPKDLELGNNTKVIPSVICITKKEDQAYIGESAFSPEILAKAEMFVCFKQAPKEIQGEKECLMKRYMREVYKRICENNSALLTSTNHCVYIATPSGWDKKTQELYLEMAKEAGLPVAGITTESRAAFVHAQSDPTSGVPKFIDKGAIVFDMGSSTLDFTYLRGQEKPIDFGYNCGASYIEKAIYSEQLEKNEWVKVFADRHRELEPALLFEARKIKEKVYFDPTLRVRQTINFDDWVYDSELEDKTCKYVFQPGELNQLLETKGYFQQLRDAMFDFKQNHINNEPIYGVFLTGGASRMDFIKPLIKECWGIEETQIFRDQDPSLTISRGIAEVGRADIRVSGQIPEIKNKVEDIINSTIIFNEFANNLVERLYESLEQRMKQSIAKFKNCTPNRSIQDLENLLDAAIQNCMIDIQELAKDCFNKAFENSIQQIRIQLEELIRNYSSRQILIHVAPLSLKKLPAMKFDAINVQLAEITKKFMQKNSGLLNGVAGAAIGGVVGLILGGPLAWIVGGGYLLGKLFGPEKTEAEKEREAKNKKLNAKARAKIYDYFDEDWENITKQLHKSIKKAISENQMIKNAVTTETSKALREYVNECLLQARLILD